MLSPSDYVNLFSTAVLTQETLKVKELDYICRVATLNESQYRHVEGGARIPWPLIAAIHFRESNQDFTKHLHNGDPLTAKTVHEPRNRPTWGQPPYSWVDSAQDALSSLWKPVTWDIAGCLEFSERYNGIGYQKHGVNTPYLWDYTSKYDSGLFVADGSFDPTKKECRPGIVSILKTLAQKGVSLDFTSIDSGGSLLH